MRVTSAGRPGRFDSPFLLPPAVRYPVQISDLIAQMGGLQSMSRELGVSESAAASGGALLDDVLAPEPTNVTKGTFLAPSSGRRM